MNQLSRLLAWCFIVVVALVAAVFLGMGLIARPDSEEDFKLRQAGLLPVLEAGRVKPLDTLARVSLMVISGRQEYTDDDGKTQPAIRWLFDVMSCSLRDLDIQSSKSYARRSYRVEDPELRKRLQLEDSKQTLFSLKELIGSTGQSAQLLKEVVTEGRKLDPDNPNLSKSERALAELTEQVIGQTRFVPFETSHKVFRIDNLDVLALLGLEARPGFRYAFDEFSPRLAQLFRESNRALAVKDKYQTVYDTKVIELRRHVELYIGLAMHNAPSLHLVVPSAEGEDWKPMREWQQELSDARKANAINDSRLAPVKKFDEMLDAYAAGNKKAFNRALAEYEKLAGTVLPTDSRMANLESWFNAFAPFYRCAILYVMIFLVACVSWLWRDITINRFAFWFLVAVALVHTLALILRMVIQGRPPVTNLYSSAVFIGWFCVVLCIGLEMRFRIALATAIGALSGYSTLLIAHYLGGSGDTLEMMQAVLDTNFWLATHVTTVTIGYSATFVAGLFGIVYLWMMLITTVLNSLRQGGALSLGQLTLFVIAAVSASLFAAIVYVSVLAGLWYLANRDFTVGILLGGLSVVLTVIALVYSGYLVLQRLQLTDPRQAGQDLPPGTHLLELFALTEAKRKVLVWMMYGTVCFALLFSFVGTVLGGIWADQSWGRFWGWDPKENGALLIVIMNALILHARWGGMIKERGMAILTLVGNMVTMWSWFGTNQLGIGLHAYGFNNALVLLCRYFWLSQLALIGLALLPYSHCRDYTPLPTPEKADEPTPERERQPGKSRRGTIGTLPV